MNEQSQITVRVKSPEIGEFTQLAPWLPCIIGRSPACGIFIDDPSISNRHAVLTHSREGGVMVRDLESTNGVIYDGRKVQQTDLNLPAELILGNVSVNILAEKETASETDNHIESEELLHTSAKESGKKEKKPDSGIAPRSSGLSKTEQDITCPHCWHRFALEDFLYIARHHDLTGDPLLGEDAQQRFLPSKFTPEGHAVDSAGWVCPEVACPRCHLRLPKTLAAMPPLFVSLVGAPASGKSYLLTSMMWELRNTLAQKFAITITDTDAVSNQLLNEFEEALFLTSDPDRKTALKKTELQGEMYNQVRLDNMLVNLLKPFLFTLRPSEHHPDYENVRHRVSRTLVVYDNAGEHFEPGMDSVENPGTQHLMYSDTVFFLFDPTKDSRFRKRLGHQTDPQLSKESRVQRQEVLLTEMNNRIEKYTGKQHREKSDKTLVIIVPKCDLWLDLLGYDIPVEPWRWQPNYRTYGLDVDCIMRTSFSIRCLLEEICPELVANADAFTDDLVFLPNSALGCSPELDEQSGMLGVYPRDIKPFWAQVPLIYFLHQHGLTPVLDNQQLPEMPLTEVTAARSGDIFFVDLPNRKLPLQVPKNYKGYRLRCPETGQWFRISND